MSFYSNQEIKDAFWLFKADTYRKYESDKPSTLGDKWPYRKNLSLVQGCLEESQSYDSPKGGYGQVKIDGFAGSHVWSVDKGADIKPEDLLHIVQPDGSLVWMAVRGFDQNRVVLEEQVFRVTPCAVPALIG